MNTSLITSSAAVRSAPHERTQRRRAMTTDIKRSVFKTIRNAHLAMACRPLPEKVAIYFHALERHQWPAFREAMSALLADGYRTVDVASFTRFDDNGKQLFISFDDNYSSWHDALAMLDDLGVHATFYLNSAMFADRASPEVLSAYFDQVDHQGERRSLSTSQLGEIVAAGHGVGSHTRTHPMLATLPADLWHDEIIGCRLDLEDLLARPVTDFSFPFGMRRHFSAELKAFCVANGMTSIVSGMPGLQHAQCDPFDVARTPWRFELSLKENLENLQIDARWFTTLTGRSAVG